MKFTTKLKLFMKIIFVLVIVGSLFMYLNYSMSRKASVSGRIQSNKVQIGLAYPGTLVEVFVNDGQTVQEGQSLVSVQGPEIADAIADNVFATSKYSIVDTTNQVTLLAMQDGIVDELEYAEGSYSSANGAIMTISQLSNQYVTARFRLSPPDYGKVAKDSKVIITLPDNVIVEASVTDIALENDTNSDDVLTVLKVSPTSNAAALAKFPINTPVKATLILNTKTVFETFKEYVRNLLQPEGSTWR